MRKNIYFLLIISLQLMFTACTSEKDNFAKLYPGLVPKESDEYSLYAVGEEVRIDALRDEGIRDVNTITNQSSLEVANNTYPKLELNETPIFVLFDENGLVAKTNSFDELIRILESNEN